MKLHPSNSATHRTTGNDDNKKKRTADTKQKKKDVGSKIIVNIQQSNFCGKNDTK